MSRLDASFLSEFLDRGVVLQADESTLWLGAGEWEWLPEPTPCALHHRPFFYAPDFFLKASRPWFTPRQWVECTPRDLVESLPPAPPLGPLGWQAASADRFASQWADLQRRFHEGLLQKAVPVIFERCEAQMSPERLCSTLFKLLHQPGQWRLYGFWDSQGGMLGATPELLFTWEPGKPLTTMALAGTRSPLPRETWEDPKELHEHQLVVDDVTESLRPLGVVTQSPRSILRRGALEHFLTEIKCQPFEPPQFFDLVRALHPTAALGVYPRAAGWHWLRELDGPEDRERFGAPFGACWPGGRIVCVVAIRGVQWRGCEWKLGSGCGILPESQLEREWEELRLKRQFVKGWTS